MKVPRLNSLHHRLRHAKDAEGRPIALRDELLFFLDDPPAGTGDRWQEGADLCQRHGIQTSRMSVYRFFRGHILEWRRAQNPAPTASPPDPEETARLLDHARHLAAQRLLEFLNDPHLSAGHLVGLIQNDNHRQQIQLARDQFNDRIAVRCRLEQKQYFQRKDEQIRNEIVGPAQMELLRKTLAAHPDVPPHTTS